MSSSFRVSVTRDTIYIGAKIPLLPWFMFDYSYAFYFNEDAMQIQKDDTAQVILNTRGNRMKPP